MNILHSVLSIYRNITNYYFQFFLFHKNNFLSKKKEDYQVQAILLIENTKYNKLENKRYTEGKIRLISAPKQVRCTPIKRYER